MCAKVNNKATISRVEEGRARQGEEEREGAVAAAADGGETEIRRAK